MVVAIAFYGAALLLAGPAAAKRVALVIGNADYAHVSSLPNPANDSTDIAAALTRIGFEVTRGNDLDYREMRLALRDFAEAASEAEMVLIYFAGHGIEIDNTNYLIPVNAELKSDRDIEFEAIRLDTVVGAVASVDGLKVILVDACRNNPFLSDMIRTSATRSIGRGLGRIDPGGVLVGYAARGGTLALDGEGRNSPYAQALLRHIEEPGLELGKMFRKVRDTVFDLTDGYQEPFTYGSLPGDDIFLVARPEPAALALPPAEGPGSKIAAAFAEADRVASIGGWSDFLTRFAEFPVHPLVALAVQKRAALLNGPARQRGSLGRATGEIEDELTLYAAAEKLASPRGWALFFDRYPLGRLASSALVKEEKALMGDLRARVFGRYRAASDGEQMTPSMTAMALKMHDLSDRRVRQIQQSLASRGNDVGAMDGEYGPRTRRAMEAFQRGRGLPVNGAPTRATLAALKVYDAQTPMADLYPTSGAISRVFDREAALTLEQDDRVGRLLDAFEGRSMIYGFHEGSLYASIFLGTTFGEADLVRMLDRAGGRLVEFDSRAEEAFVFEMIRYDQKMWHNMSVGYDDGPSIGLGHGEGGWQWRSGKALSYTNWATGQPRAIETQSALGAGYGRLVPAGRLPKNATRIERARWAVDSQLSPTIIIEIE